MQTSSFLGWTGLRRPWPRSPRRADREAYRSIFSCWTRDHAFTRSGVLSATMQSRCDITLLSTERNLGVAGGRNLISGLGHGRVIVALDNDAEFAGPDTVAQMVAALDAEPRLGGDRLPDRDLCQRER